MNENARHLQADGVRFHDLSDSTLPDIGDPRTLLADKKEWETRSRRLGIFRAEWVC